MTYRYYLIDKLEKSRMNMFTQLFTFIPALSEKTLALLLRTMDLYGEKLLSKEMMRAGEVKAILNLTRITNE